MKIWTVITIEREKSSKSLWYNVLKICKKIAIAAKIKLGNSFWIQVYLLVKIETNFSLFDLISFILHKKPTVSGRICNIFPFIAPCVYVLYLSKYPTLKFEFLLNNTPNLEQREDIVDLFESDILNKVIK